MKKQSNSSFISNNQHLKLFQPLLPDHNQDLRISKKYQHKVPTVDPNVLLAIDDQSFVKKDINLENIVISMYSRLSNVIRPDNLWLMVWYSIIGLIFFYYIIQMGLIMAFGQQFWKDQMQYAWWLQLVWIIILLADILISPLKAYYADGILIKDIKLILRNYLKLEIYLDITCVLIIGIPMIFSSTIEVNWLKLLWFIKIYSIQKINECYQRITQLYIIPNTCFLVCKLIMFSIVYAHFMAIFFYIISMYLYRTNYYGPNTPNIIWVYNSWAFYQIVLLRWYNAYSYIIYYGIEFVTTIAYGDITPKNPIECLYTILAFITQSIFWGYILSQILRLLINVYSYNFDRRYHHFALNYKLKKQNVSDNTFRQVQQHTQQIDKDQQFRNRVVEQEVLRFLPPDSLYSLLLAIHKDAIRLIGFDFAKSLSYKNIGQNDSKSIFLEQFMKQIKEERHFAGDVFYTQGQVQQFKPNNHCAYFYTNPTYRNSVVLGVGKHVTMKLEQQQQQYTLIEPQGSYKLHTVNRYFGQVQFLTGINRNHWAICSKNCLLFSVSRSTLLKYYHLLTLEERQAINLRAELAPNRFCLVCQNSHNYFNCPYVFAVTRQVIEQQQKATRSMHLRSHDRTRMKSISSWRVYSEIKNIKMPITHEYTQRLLFQKDNEQYFVDLQLQQALEDCPNIEEEMHQTQVILDTLIRKELEDLDLAQQIFTSSTAYNFKIYKPQNNIDSIISTLRDRTQLKLLKRNAISLRMTI